MIFSSKTLIPSSATVTINSIAQAKKRAGERVFNLSAGEPMVPTAHFVRDAVITGLQKGEAIYPPAAGLEELRELASNWINIHYQTNYSATNTLVTCGGKFGIYLTLQALLNEGDEVLIPAPHWVSYPAITQLFGGKPIIISTRPEDNWKISPEAIKNACTEKTKLLIINNAGNPTGVLYTKEELKSILQIAEEKNILVLSDEVYSGLTYDNETFTSCASFPQYADRIVTIQSCSKNFSMTGWRVGFVFANTEILATLIKLQSQSITGTSIVSQWAAIEAIKKSDTIMPLIQKEMQHRRDVFTNTFNKTFNVKITSPKAAFYHFIPLSAFGTNETDDVKFCENMIQKANVAIVPGSAFGMKTYIRTSFGEIAQELEEAIHMLKQHTEFSA